MQRTLLNYPNLDIRAGSVFDFNLDEHTSESHKCAKVAGIKLGPRFYTVWMICQPSQIVWLDSGEHFHCTQVVICTGTFLAGEIHIGIVTEFLK
jgi:tRNA uridine 5-carboxymethylaminomethyl modification enzyme